MATNRPRRKRQRGTPNPGIANRLPRRAHGAETRERVIDAAIGLFWEKGYAETSLADLMAVAKVNAGSFYYFFRSKENLLTAVLERYKVMLHAVLLAPIYEKTADPIERIFALLGRYREGIIGTNCTYGCPIGRLAMEISPAMTGAHQLLAANFEGWSNEVQKNLEAACERFPADTDFRSLSRFVLTVMEGGVMQSRSYRSVEPFDQAVAQLREYFKRLFAAAGTNSPTDSPGPELIDR
jgi:TetR/AcrR family transcriptional regulator, transcriptional repressor for nem operon